MPPEFRREQIRLSLLRHLDDNCQWGVILAFLHSLIHCEGFHATPEEIKTELFYLQDKGLVTQVHKTISPENQAWRITAAGRDHRATTA